MRGQLLRLAVGVPIVFGLFAVAAFIPLVIVGGIMLLVLLAAAYAVGSMIVEWNAPVEEPSRPAYPDDE